MISAAPHRQRSAKVQSALADTGAVASRTPKQQNRQDVVLRQLSLGLGDYRMLGLAPAGDPSPYQRNFVVEQRLMTARRHLPVGDHHPKDAVFDGLRD